MSVTIIIGKRHALAALAVLALGTLVAFAALAPSSTQAVTYLTRSASCAGVNFYPDNSGDQYITYLTDRLNNSTAPEGFRCNAALPNGAIVTKLQVTFDQGGTCFLTRAGLSTAEGFTHMASVTNLGGTTRVSTTTITSATIDNANNAYTFDCTLNGDSGLIGADVIYKITAAKG